MGTLTNPEDLMRDGVNAHLVTQWIRDLFVMLQLVFQHLKQKKWSFCFKEREREKKKSEFCLMYMTYDPDPFP